MTEEAWLVCRNPSDVCAELCKRKQPSRARFRTFFEEMEWTWDKPAYLMFGERGRDAAVREADLIRCFFGNPFRPVTLDSSLRTSTVTQLVQAIYEERAFDRMPILADALEDAGCSNQDILSHCRGREEHVRGCWVVDLLLGKEDRP
jgi:hypothetical protein